MSVVLQRVYMSLMGERMSGRENERTKGCAIDKPCQELTCTWDRLSAPYPAMMAPMLAITHSVELKPIIPTPWKRSRPT